MNLFSDISEDLSSERFEDLLKTETIRIERIISRGHTSPDQGWYDQEENEWVAVLEGAGKIGFEDGREVLLQRGDCLEIPAHARHRVVWTDPDTPTIWLAVFYG